MRSKEKSSKERLSILINAANVTNFLFLSLYFTLNRGCQQFTLSGTSPTFNEEYSTNLSMLLPSHICDNLLKEGWTPIQAFVAFLGWCLPRLLPCPFFAPTSAFQQCSHWLFPPLISHWILLSTILALACTVTILAVVVVVAIVVLLWSEKHNTVESHYKKPPFSSSPSLCSVRVAALTEASVGLGREQLTEAPRRLLAPRSVFRCSGGQLDRPRISAAGPISPEHW